MDRPKIDIIITVGECIGAVIGAVIAPIAVACYWIVMVPVVAVRRSISIFEEMKRDVEEGR